jgi:hypothetical protein
MTKDKYCKIVVKKYTKNPNTKTTYTETESEPERWINEQEYNRIIEASPFFKNLGGSEYHIRGYTSQGYKTVKLISKSPDRKAKTIRWFIFDNEYPGELVQ